MSTTTCDKCGTSYGIGFSPYCRDRHEPVGRFFHEGFEPYVDVQLLSRDDPRCTGVNEIGMRGVPINSRSERRNLMKELGLQYGSGKWRPGS